MDQWVILLRGINVGGHGKLPMADLRALLLAMGLQDVQTYIQSGNVVVRGPQPDAGRIMDKVEVNFGFRRDVQVFSAAAFEAVALACPFSPVEGKHLHIWFTGRVERLDLVETIALAADDEALHIGPEAVYLHAPSGIGRSKLAEKLPRYLPTRATARNWSTVQKLRAMLIEGAAGASG
jgi:uncharacterized protein (DUF1697 family)